MRRGGAPGRFGAASAPGLGLAGLVCLGSISAAAEEPMPSPQTAEARIQGAWSALRGEFDPATDRVEPTPPPALGDPAPVSPVSSPFRDGAPAASLPPVGGSAIGYAPEAGGVIFPAERAFAAGPRPIAVPLPRHRPSVPMVAERVAALDAAAGVGQADKPVEVAPILAEDGVFGPPNKIPKQALPYLHLLKREAARNKVPLWLAIGVGWVESKYDPKLRGSHSVLGIMQVMPSTARFQGYKGTSEQLLDPETNIVWGMRELGWTWAAAKGDPCLAIAKYKGGIATKSISASAWNYCTAAKKVTGMM